MTSGEVSAAFQRVRGPGEPRRVFGEDVEKNVAVDQDRAHAGLLVLALRILPVPFQLGGYRQDRITTAPRARGHGVCVCRARVPVTAAPPRSGVGRGRHLGIPAGRRLLLVLADDQPGTCRCWTCKRRTTSHLAGSWPAGRPAETGQHARGACGGLVTSTAVRWLRMHAVRGLSHVRVASPEPGPAGWSRHTLPGMPGGESPRRSHQRRTPYQRAHQGSRGTARRPERRAGRDRCPG